MYKDFINEKIFGIVKGHFVTFLPIIRSRNINFSPENPKNFDPNLVAILCPVVDLVNHFFRLPEPQPEPRP